MAIKFFPAPILLHTILLALACIPICKTSTVYVKPEYDLTHCSGEPCHILSYYQQHISQYFVSNTTVVFMNGTHSLEGLHPLVIQDIENFTMKGTGGLFHGLENLLESSSRIECNGIHRSGFKFINVYQVQIENLTFAYCSQEVFYNIHAALAFDVAHNVIFSRVTVRNSSGYGLHADQVFGNVQVYESAFLDNTGNNEYYGGNARFSYKECPENHSTYLQIESSYFLRGNDMLKLPAFRSAPGLTLLINCPSILVCINNITVAGNEGENGGNFAINLTDFARNDHYGDKVSSVIINNSKIAAGTGHRGGGLSIWLYTVSKPKEKISCNQTDAHLILQISNTQFVGNHAHDEGGALYISYYETKEIKCVTSQIFLQNCTFSGNTVPPSGYGSVIEVAKFEILGYTSPVSPQFELITENSSFHNNSLLRDKRDSFVGATVNIFSMERIIFKHCNFTNNNNTALSLVNSNVILEGHILFDGNHAINGGALRFCDSSLLHIRKNTHIIFRNNHVKIAGGAIYAQQKSLGAISPCFFQPDVPDFSYISDLKKCMSLTFVNNSAEYAGSGLYGGTIDYCYTYLRFIKDAKTASYYYSPAIVDAVFNFTKQPGDSPISSSPSGVCLCNGSHHNCNIKNYTFPRSIYPGEAFTISAVSVGQRHGVAPAAIIGTLLSSHNQSLFQPIEKSQTSERCVTLTFIIHSKNQQETFELAPEQSSHDQQETVKLTEIQSSSEYASFNYYVHLPEITISLRPCPWGFTLQHDPPYCECDLLLVMHKISCNINEQTIQREAPKWIGSYNMKLNSSRTGLPTMCSIFEETDQGTCHGVFIHHHCPFDYCILKNINISVNSTDEQCAFHRNGILCGKCQDGYSLILGSSKCLPCSNLYFLLLIVFVLAGLVLVIFLIVWNLTVSEGRITGLIFYANIVHINKTIFFPSTKANPLAVFIAWLNLDLGIETCFYNGMDAYAKAWLQFVFPIYIWLIAGLIILLSRRYTIAARLCGRNAVKVLATLFILSVAKLGRAIITAISYTVLDYPDGSHVSVWLPDANVKFLQGKHVPLFITAVAFCAVVLCFVLVLTFIPCLQKKSDMPFLFWVNKLKPFFDAYTGPYRDRYRFWPGLLLLLLCILIIIFSLNNLDRPNMKLMLTAINCFFVLALAWVFCGVHRKWPREIIESSCILNLGLLAVVTSYILNDGNNQNTQFVVVNISAGIVFLTLIVVLGFQTYEKLATSVFCNRFFSALSVRMSGSLEEPIANWTDEPNPELGPEQDSNMREQLLPPVIHFDKYREPVFEYEDEST